MDKIIHILFHTGAFGTTIEYCIKRFSNKFTTNVVNPFDTNHSLHRYTKEKHLQFDYQIKNFNRKNVKITTPVYPLRTKQTDTPTVESSINLFKNIVQTEDKVIFVVFDNIKSLYINYLLKFNKVSLEDLTYNINLENAKMWNPNINAVTELKREELRELLSIQFLDTVDNYLSAKELADKNWLIITPDNLINDFKSTIESIFDYLDLEKDDTEELNSFASVWKQEQQEIIDRFEIINSKNYDQTLSLAEEVIIHSILKQQGIDIGTEPLLKVGSCF
jgi:transcriptional regulator of heat shock response